MSPFRSLLVLFLAFLAVQARAEGERPHYSLGDDAIHGAPVRLAKTVADTINLMASHRDPTNGPDEPYYFGDFEDENGNPAENGWTSIDITQPTEHHWQVSNYNQADPANLAAWCGDISIPSCDDSLDPAGGYGNVWHDILEFRQTVPVPSQPTTLNLTGILQIDTEPGYDYVYISHYPGTGPFTDVATWDGERVIDLDQTINYLPADYAAGTDVILLIRFKSDGGWSDADCSWPTAGALQADDLGVHLANGDHELDFFTDFQDSTLGDWAPAFPPGVGDFFKVWTGLRDVDPCLENLSPQAAFIDDGLVVPGTGGSECINWCYGPQGYIVTTTGGLAGPEAHLFNEIDSPVMDWPNPEYDGIQLTVGIYRHEDLSSDAPGIFYSFGTRSADTDGDGGQGIQDIHEQPALRHNSVWYGGPDYVRHTDDITDLMNRGRDQIQVALYVEELGFAWGWTGNDGYPAPYFDNITVKIFPLVGPRMRSREIDLANDGFPERGSLDFGDLGSLNVRFDMARNISLASHLHVDFGDSMVVDIVPVRSGSSLHGTPEMRYILKRNPVFDPYRTAGLPDQGSVPGFPAVGASGIPDPSAWAFDLPDTGFLFPGDVLHYYVYAEDSIDGADVIGVSMPADTTGFSTGFDDPLGYDSTFTIHALPTVLEDGFGGYTTPPILFWNDFGGRGGEDEWYSALGNVGKVEGRDYDVYYTNGPTSGVGNGLGGRAGSDLVLEEYTDLLYTAGNLSVFTISNGDFNNDASDDVGVLTSWLLQGGKDLLVAGDGVAGDLAVNGGTSSLVFAEEWLGVNFLYLDLRTYIDNQTYPLVRAEPENPVFQTISSWVAYGHCPRINWFDAVEAGAGAQRLAEFTDPAGQIGAYTFSAATLNIPDSPGTSRVLSLPYDLMSVHTDPGAKAEAPLPGRSLLLGDVLTFFGLPFDPGSVSQKTPTLIFTVANHPNPFNPATRIVYTVPQAGHLSLKVYDIRGRLVRTLVDGRVPAGADQVAVWDGTDDRGAGVSSGVYFYEARTGGEVEVGKMALVK